MNAGAIRQSRVDQGRREIDAPSERRDEPLDEDQDLVGIREADAGLLETPVALDGVLLRTAL